MSRPSRLDHGPDSSFDTSPAMPGPLGEPSRFPMGSLLEGPIWASMCERRVIDARHNGRRVRFCVKQRFHDIAVTFNVPRIQFDWER